MADKKAKDLLKEALIKVASEATQAAVTSLDNNGVYVTENFADTIEEAIHSGLNTSAE